MDVSDSGITKRALATSMKELMATRPFAEVTVGDICANCGLNRKSLYYHFQDKYDLVNFVFYDELIRPLEEEPPEDFWALLEVVTGYLYANRMFYYHAFHILGEDRTSGSFWNYFSQYLRPPVLAAVRNKLSASVQFSAREKEEAYAEFLADAFVLSLEKWIVHYPQCTPERYVDLFRI